MSEPVSRLKLSENPEPRAKSVFSFIGDKGLLLVAVLLVFVGALSWGALDKIKKQVRFDIQEILQRVLYTTHESINRWVENRIEDSLLVVDRPDVKQLVRELLALPRDRERLANSVSQQQLRTIIKPLLEEHSDLGMFVIAPDGTNIASMRNTDLGQENLFCRYQVHFENMLKGEPQLVLPLLSDVALPGLKGKFAQGEPTIFLGVPLKDDNGSVIAAFTLRINPSLDFTKIVHMARTGQTGDSYVFDKDGKLISEVRFKDHLRTIGLIRAHERPILKLLDPGGNLLEGFQPTTPRENLPLTFMAQRATAGEPGLNLDGYRDYRGVPVVGIWRWHEKYNFGHAFEIDVDEAYRSYFAIRRTVIGLLATTVFLFLGLSVGLVRRKRQADAMNIQLAQEVVARQKSEDKFRALLESSPDGMIITNKAGDIILINRQVEKMFGYSSEELLGRKIELLIPERFAGKHPELRALYFENLQMRPMEEELDLWGVRKDGREFPLEIALSPVETGGEIVAIASIHDISKRREAEEKIRKSEAGLAEAQRIAHFGNWELDIANNSLHWSDEVYRIFGLKPQEFEATYEAFLENVHPDDREMVNRAYVESLKDKTPYEIIHRLKLKDGTVKHVKDRCETYYDKKGKPVRSVGTVQDITEQKKADEELEQHREHLEELVAERTSELRDREETLSSITSSAQVAIIMIDNDGLVTFWNESAERIFGWSQEEVTGKDLHKLIAPGKYHTQYSKGFRQFQQTGEGVCIGVVRELTAFRKNGEEFHVELALSAVKKEDKWHSIGIVSDITDRKEAEAELRKNMDELERFSKMAIGREQQMIRLKEQINELLSQSGRNEKYKIVK